MKLKGHILANIVEDIPNRRNRDLGGNPWRTFPMSAELIRLLRMEDLPFAQKVREIAGWNQTDTDWERMIRFEPEGCFLVECDGAPAGTATTTIHKAEVGWIGMVLVHPDFRRRGLATMLLKKCVEYLTPRTQCIKLDATPAGMMVYEKLGFVEESRLHRWEGIASGERAESSVRNKVDGVLVEMDRVAFGADRSGFLEALAESSFTTADPNGEGYGMIREGINASYLGPVVAANSEVGSSLITSLLAQKGGEKIYWDILAENQSAVELATELGFVKQRELIRMRLGESGFEGDSTMQWAITGPETA